MLSQAASIFIAFYHMGIYGDPVLLKWSQQNIQRPVSESWIGVKHAARFKKTENIPYKLIGELRGKMTVEKWITMYEKNIKR